VLELSGSQHVTPHQRHEGWKSHSAGGRPQIHAELQATERVAVLGHVLGVDLADERTLSCGCPRAVQRLLVSSSKAVRMEGFQSNGTSLVRCTLPTLPRVADGLVALVWGYVLRAAEFQHPFATSATADGTTQADNTTTAVKEPSSSHEVEVTQHCQVRVDVSRAL
jgi:hypothetical protein